MRESFLFYGSWYVSARRLDPERRLAFLETVLDYAVFEREPDADADMTVLSLFDIVKPALDGNRSRYENRKVGAPRGNANARKKNMAEKIENPVFNAQELNQSEELNPIVLQDENNSDELKTIKKQLKNNSAELNSIEKQSSRVNVNDNVNVNANEEEVEEEGGLFSPPSSSFPVMESENPDYAAVKIREEKVSVDELCKEFSGDQYLVEICRMKYGMGLKEMEGYLEQFRLYLHAVDEHVKTQRDFKPHFLNWLNINVYKDRRLQRDNAARGQTEEPDERHLQRVRELYPDNDAFLVKSFAKYVKHHRMSPDRALEHFERAKREGWTYNRMLFRIDGLELIYKD